MKNPLIRIIEHCLKLWIKSRCDKISSIKINIKELNQRLFNSEISDIKLVAENLEFNNLPINYLRLRCDSIKIELDLSNKRIVFKEEFDIKGDIKLNSKGLQCALNKTRWHWLSKIIAKGLLNKDLISSIKINNNDNIELEGTNSNDKLKRMNHFKIYASSGKINLESIDHSKTLQIPMEDSIYIEHSELSDGLLVLKGYAEINEKG